MGLLPSGELHTCIKWCADVLLRKTTRTLGRINLITKELICPRSKVSEKSRGDGVPCSSLELAFTTSQEGAAIATGRKAEYGAQIEGRLVDWVVGKWWAPSLIKCLIEEDVKTLVLQRAKEGNEHKQSSQERCSQAHSSPVWSPRTQFLENSRSRWDQPDRHSPEREAEGYQGSSS